MAKVTTILINSVSQYDELGLSWVETKDRIVYHEQVLCDAHMPIAIKVDGDYTPKLSTFLSHTTTESKSNINKWNIKYKILIRTSTIVEKTRERTIGYKDSKLLDGTPCKSPIIEEYKENVTEINSVWKEIKDLSSLQIKKDEYIVIDICGNKSARLGNYSADIIPKLTFSTKLTMELSSYAWWNASWSYKKKVNLANASSGYQIKLLIGSDTGEGSCNVDCNSHCKTDFSDLRFTNSAENAELDYWIESYTTDGVAVVWIETNGDSEFYMYYGNAGASTTSNGDNTFQFFDDFTGAAMDGTKWDMTGSNVLQSMSGGIAVFYNYHATGRYSGKTAYARNYALRFRAKATGSRRMMNTGFGITAASPYTTPEYGNLSDGGASIEYFYWADTIGYQSALCVNPNDETYALYDIERTSTNIIGKYNGVSKMDSSTNDPTGSVKPAIGYAISSSETHGCSMDWILVRKRPDTLTTVSSFGAEETNTGGTLTKSLSSSLIISDSTARTSVFQRTFSDNVSIADLISKQPGLMLSDAVALADDFDYLRILLLSETLTLADDRVFEYGKGLSNTLSISDSMINDFGKNISDVLSISDLLVTLKYICRQLSDTLTISDDFQYLRGFDIFDSVSLSDTKSFEYGKGLSNTLSLSDLVRRQIRFIRTFSDTLTISDSCITSLYTAYFKILSDTLILNDLFRKQMVFKRSINETLTMSETIQKDVHKILHDTLTINEIFLCLKESAYLLSLFDTLSITSAASILKNQTLNLSDTLVISDLIMAISSKDMELLDSTGTILTYLRRPYWDNLDGSLNFNSMNFAFRSGNYTSYVEDINDESITFTGYESADDVLTRFNKIADLADDGTEITISLLGTLWDATYVVSSFTYRPIGLDVFEYTLTLKLVR
jgi:hypothetical protein